MNALRNVALALALLAGTNLGLATSANADEAFVGTWHGVAKHNKTPIELTVTGFDAGGYARGIYCQQMPNTSNWFTDLEPDQALVANLDHRNRLRFEIGNTTWWFQPKGSSGEKLRMRTLRKGQRLRMDVSRIAREDARCTGRVATLGEPATAPTPEPTAEGLEGTWIAHWANTDATTEIRIEDATPGAVRGTYCHRRQNSHSVVDLDPDAGIPATIDGNTLTFRSDTTPNPTLWRFTRNGDALAFTYQHKDGKTHRATLTKGDAACLSRVKPLSR